MKGPLDALVEVHPDVQGYSIDQREEGTPNAYWIARIEVGTGPKPAIIIRGYGYTRGAAMRSATDQLKDATARRKI